MTERPDIKVFISWSGDLSKAVALALREWLPLLFDRVAPWASDTDIAAGQRGLAQIEGELADTRFGIVVVTAENQHAPWLNFEAGALSRTVVANTEHRVVPLMVDLAGIADLTGPLSQFQAKPAQRDGVRDVVRSLAAVAGVDANTADQRFNAYWPLLEEKIEAARKAAPGGSRMPERRRPEAEVLDEVLQHVRALRADLSSTAPRDDEPTITLSGLRRIAETDAQRFHERVSDLAHRYGLVAQELSRLPNGVFEIFVSPVGEYDSSQAAAFEEAVAALPRNRSKVKVSTVPF